MAPKAKAKKTPVKKAVKKTEKKVKKGYKGALSAFMFFSTKNRDEV